MSSTGATIIDDIALVTMDARRQVLDPGWVRIDGPMITALGAGTPPPEHVEGAQRIHGHGGVLTPGLVSTHDHMVDTLLRGGIEVGRGLDDWLINVNFAGLAGYTPDDAALAVTISIAEALTAGITTVTDNWGIDNGVDRGRTDDCTDATAEVYRRAGIRVTLAMMFADTFPERGAGLSGAHRHRVPSARLDPTTLTEKTDDALDRIRGAAARHHGTGGGRVRVCPSPELVPVVSLDGLRGARELAADAGTPWCLHLCEGTADARLFAESGTSMGVPDWLDAVGLLGPDLLAAHAVVIDDRDARLLARHDTKVAHVPLSNAKLAQGTAPIASLHGRGVTVGLGNDNGNLSERSILAQARHALLAAATATGDPGALSPWDVFAMATIGGARALGLDDSIGSIEVGKRGDLVLFSRAGSHWWPHHDLAAALVFQARSTDVRTVLVDGQVVVDDGRPTFLDDVPAGAAVQRAARAVLDRAGLTPLTTPASPVSAAPRRSGIGSRR